MPILYLHVGPHKTGSTYIQVELKNAARALQSQKVLYPEAGREFLDGHHNIANFFSSRGLNKTTQSELSAKLSQLANTPAAYEKIILSSENFMGLSADNLRSLRSFFRNFDFYAVYFRRNDPRLIFSMWSNLVLHGYKLPLNVVNADTFIQQYGYNPFAHEENIARLGACLQGGVAVLDYTELMSRKVDIFDEFCKVIGIKAKAVEKTVNPTPLFEHIELVRAANLYHQNLQFPQTSYPRVLCMELLHSGKGKLLNAYLAEKVKQISKILPPQDLARAGFPSTNLTQTDAAQTIRYVPNSALLEVLEVDNIPEWQALKKRMENLTINPNRVDGDYLADESAYQRTRRFLVRVAKKLKIAPLLQKIRSNLR